MMKNSKYYTDESSLEQDEEWEDLSLANHTQDNSWEVLTEVESVLSFDVSTVSSVLSKKGSYKDALLCEGVIGHHKNYQTAFVRQDKIHNKKKMKQTKENNVQSENEVDDFSFDAFQMMEGVKYGRGGKASQWFSNNKTTNKQLPKDLRKCLRRHIKSRNHKDREGRKHFSTNAFRYLN